MPNKPASFQLRLFLSANLATGGAGAIAPAISPPYGHAMFTIEHDFDATVITLIDEPGSHLQEDIIISAFEDCVTVEQYDERLDKMQKVTFSLAQVRELAAALDLPEGVYRLKRPPVADS